MAFMRAHILLGAALVLGSAQGASAADLYGGSLKDGPMMAAPMATPSPSWYVRVDGNYGAFDTPAVTEDGIWDLTDTSIGNTWGVGGGIGVYFGRGFRGDITVEHNFDADVSATLADVNTTLPGVRDFTLSSTYALANLYYDFDMGNRFTPYIGVGLGVTKNKTGAGTVTDLCGCLSGTIDSGEETHVAGAVMAGFSVRLRERLSFDAGYRFLYLGEVATGPVNATFTAAHGGNAAGSVVANDPLVDEIHEHEFRFGLRYDIN
jgi:opacity protein-like surface antigen